MAGKKGKGKKKSKSMPPVPMKGMREEAMEHGKKCK
jgi:hypothetical protein